MDLEFKIKQQFQKDLDDCGQTCLDMLGYDGHGIFPDQPILPFDLLTIPEIRDANYFSNLNSDHSVPHMLGFLGKYENDDNRLHWAVRYGNKVYCPIAGTVDAKEYGEIYMKKKIYDFVVPFKIEMNQENQISKLIITHFYVPKHL